MSKTLFLIVFAAFVYTSVYALAQSYQIKDLQTKLDTCELKGE